MMTHFWNELKKKINKNNFSLSFSMLTVPKMGDIELKCEGELHL